MKKATRIYHTWDKWECYPAGFYENGKDGIEDEQAKGMYRDFLADLPRFRRALDRVLAEWKRSCEHYLTNERMNRIAWLGQAAACVEMGLPSRYRSGWFLLEDRQRQAADLLAYEYLNKWLNSQGYECVTLENSGVFCKANLY